MHGFHFCHRLVWIGAAPRPSSEAVWYRNAAVPELIGDV
jgi:hypothetical protein